MRQRQIQYCHDCDTVESSDEPGICHHCRGHNVSSELTITIFDWNEEETRYEPIIKLVSGRPPKS